MPTVGCGPAYVQVTPPATTVVPSQITIQQVAGPAAGVVIAPGSLVFADTTFGTVGLVPPASGVFPVGTIFGVADSGDNASVNHINIAGASIAIEDPNAPGTFPAGVNITTNSQVVWWIWGPRPGGVNGWKIWAEDDALPPVQPLATLANGTADQLVGMNHADTAPTYFTVGGDLTLASGSFTVVKIAGATISPLATLANGGADALLGMNHGASAPSYFTVAGDLTLASGSFTVAKISGASPIPITPAILQWAKGTAGPTLQQDAQTTDTACSNLTIASQAPFASATGTNRNPGNVVVNIPAPASGGASGFCVVENGGLAQAAIGVDPGNSTFGCLWLSNTTAGSPTQSNPCLLSNGGGTILACTGGSGGSIQIQVANTNKAQFGANGVQLGGGSQAFGGGTGVVGITDRSVAPTTNPSGGGILYSEAGAGKWRGSSGTVTTFGPAEPHCPSCGSDFMTEHENAVYGYLAVCLKCMADELGTRPWILREKPRKA